MLGSSLTSDGFFSGVTATISPNLPYFPSRPKWQPHHSPILPTVPSPFPLPSHAQIVASATELLTRASLYRHRAGSFPMTTRNPAVQSCFPSVPRHPTHPLTPSSGSNPQGIDAQVRDRGRRCQKHLQPLFGFASGSRGHRRSRIRDHRHHPRAVLVSLAIAARRTSVAVDQQYRPSPEIALPVRNLPFSSLTIRSKSYGWN
jgi:hypothetical protein